MKSKLSILVVIMLILVSFCGCSKKDIRIAELEILIEELKSDNEIKRKEIENLKNSLIEDNKIAKSKFDELTEKLNVEINTLETENRNLNENIQQYKRDLKWAYNDLRNLLEERNYINEEFISEINSYYDTLDIKQKIAVDNLIPSRTKYDIYNLKKGDKYKDFTVDKLDLFYNDYGKVVEYYVFFRGEATITGQLYYNRSFDGDVLLKIDKSNLSKLPHSYSYEYINIINTDEIKNDLKAIYVEGIEVTITINGYEVSEEDYTYGHTGIYYKCLNN